MHGSTKSLPVGLSIVSIVCFNFASYVGNGLPLAVLPGHVLNTLGFGTTMAGLVIGLQYLTTLLSRPLAGQLADRFGAKRTVMTGLAILTVSGLLTALAIVLPAAPWVGLTLLMAGRVLQGISSALISTPSCTWAIGLHGPLRTAQVMSWNGIAAYGGTAIGAPLGVLVRDHLGLAGIGIGITLLGFLPLLFAQTRRPAPLLPGVRLPFRSVFMAVLPNGLAVACSSAGFGSLTAFVALYFDSLGWENAAYCLSAFGVAFIFARLASPSALPRFGGYRVVTICMAVQTFGLLLVWLAPSPLVAILGSALTGLGVSWVYPGLAVETLARTPEANRNSALSTLSLFFDLAVGLAGPVMGLVVSGFGLAQVFFCSALLSAIGWVLVLSLHWRQPAARS
ncbi:putative MFS family arabinose efflux permease [Pseudomonas sp. SJZ079]|uniref:MFS transporter n=1 Tax=Pseudomonas sp. SJZ079 TaxID=2572887 RepID=UPI00119A3ACF|nr:MFS transporter [Pseudomonas sp. SJZ079]TWC40185.1 putative MFS family arabinose efflux permease [Pseudomonas sp. SJZ079]